MAKYKKIIATDKAPQAIGPYSQAILANNTVYCSGQIPADPVTGEFPESVEEQTAQCLKNLAAVLEAAGCTLNDIVKTTVFLKDMNDFAAMNGVYASYFSAPYPGRIAVQVVKLPRDARVEIEAVAVLPEV